MTKAEMADTLRGAWDSMHKLCEQGKDSKDPVAFAVAIKALALDYDRQMPSDMVLMVTFMAEALAGKLPPLRSDPSDPKAKA